MCVQDLAEATGGEETRLEEAWGWTRWVGNKGPHVHACLPTRLHTRQQLTSGGCCLVWLTVARLLKDPSVEQRTGLRARVRELQPTDFTR
jgi:hypothetical protein